MNSRRPTAADPPADEVRRSGPAARSQERQPLGHEPVPADRAGEAPVDEVSGPARVVETHTAVVFFLADRAYKIKKPVDLGFLDFTTPEARRAACERELELNRRFAPDVYLGLAQVDLPGRTPPEPLVVMRRMPDSRRLAHLVSVGAPVGDALRDVARVLAARHADARSSPDVLAEGTRDALLARWEENFREMETLVDAERAVSELAEIERLVRDYLAGRRQLFDARIQQGRVIDGHGDLLAQDVFCLDDGPRLLDCLEFDDRLRYVDGLDDAAFLAMDLEQLGASEAAAEFLSRYREFSGDPAPPSLWHHYIAYRAFVRAKVSLIQARQGIAGATAAADSLIDAVLRHLRTSAIRLILVGGLPASGKSTISGALADRLETSLLSTDRLRKELLGMSPDERAPAAYRKGIYTPERTRRTYEALLDRAAALLRHGESVVLDATWNSEVQREAAATIAGRACAELFTLRCEVPDDVATHRLEQRARGPSDADARVAEAMAAESGPWPQAVPIDTSAPMPAAVDRALSAVRPDLGDLRRRHRRPYMGPG